MQVDKTTLTDLSIFHSDEEQSVFHHLNGTLTNGGRDYFKQILSNPLDDISDILDVQHTIRILMDLEKAWPQQQITNGTIMVIEKFYETFVDPYPREVGVLSAAIYKILHATDFSLTRYTVEHSIAFIKGMHTILGLLESREKSIRIQTWCQQISHFLGKPLVEEMLGIEKVKELSTTRIIEIGSFLRDHYKRQVFELIDIFCKMDAYLGMAKACKKYRLIFPEIEVSNQPYVQTEGLFHLLLETPVAYDTRLDTTQNFIFLTGANMGGKSTYIKAFGLSVYLAHIGMGVPATSMRLSLFDGLLSNIQVEDNLLKGESYFFNEVKRIKKTIEKISDQKNWLILIDELFKGTNIQDAMKCSTAVIQGLIKMKQSLFILSTHLYEIGEGLKQFPNIQFRYFETSMQNDQLTFSYQLRDGISNDRIGYLILRREGVVEMLDQL